MFSFYQRLSPKSFHLLLERNKGELSESPFIAVIKWFSTKQQYILVWEYAGILGIYHSCLRFLQFLGNIKALRFAIFNIIREASFLPVMWTPFAPILKHLCFDNKTTSEIQSIFRIRKHTNSDYLLSIKKHLPNVSIDLCSIVVG